MKILFVCTHNRCRSILSGAITNKLGQGKIQAVSAGSQPVGEVHPLSIKYLAEAGYATEGLKSQSWDEFSDQNIDLVITVCDSAAGESCPLWMGSSLKVHWGLADPSKIEGPEDMVAQAFHKVIEVIEQRITKLLAIDFAGLSRDQLKSELNKIVL